MSYSKKDVEFHSDGCGRTARPAVNIKVRGDWRRVPLPLEFGRCDGEPVRSAPEFTRDWVEAHEAAFEAAWGQACENGVEQLIEDAKTLFGKHVKVYQEGRSGGWLVVEGLPRFDSWNAVMLGKWRQWECYCQAEARAVPADALWNLYHNAFLPEMADIERAETPV